MENSISGGGLPCSLLKPFSKQLRRVMRLTALLVTVACMQVSAHSYSQTISFSGKNVPLQTVFTSIEKQTGLSFFFNYALIENTKPVTLDLQEVALEVALHEALKDQGLDFYKSGKTVFIVKKQMNSSAVNLGFTGARQVDVNGRVTNQLGESLIGATVSVKNGKKGTITDEKGMFQLRGVPIGAKLEITYLGYKQREIEVSGEGPLLVEMSESHDQLDQAQVIAYGSTTQRLNTGNLTTVTATDLEKQPVNNPLLALEGRVPGLFVTPASGLPGTGVTVRLQGINSISSGNDPLYVVDGVPYPSQTLPTVAGGPLGGSGSAIVNGAFLGGGGNPLSYINSADIESISVLKDADATAIYGSRAANGAILISTKKGKEGPTRISINAQNGWGQVARRLKMLNTGQYLQMRHEGKLNDNQPIKKTDYDMNGLWDSTRYTDWQKTLIGGTAAYLDLSASASGGTNNMQYLIGGTYHRETPVFPGNFSDQKGSLHFNFNNSSSNKKFHINLSGSYLIDINLLPQVDLTYQALGLAPDAPALYNPDGSLNWMPTASGSSSWTNPLAKNYNIYKNRTNNLVSSLLLRYVLLPGLEIKSNFGYNNLETNEFNGFPLKAIRPENRPFSTAIAQYSNSLSESWIVEPQISYKNIISNGKIEVLLGTTIHQNNSKGQQLIATGFNNDQVLQNIAAATNIIPGQTLASTYKYNALFGRVSYNLRDEFLINLTARRDGSSRFGSENQFHNFGAVGIGWVFSQEGFFKNYAPYLSFGKLKGSYGTTGNDQIGDYQYLNQYIPVNLQVPYENISGLTPIGLTNPFIQWEETRKLQFGMELGFLKDRILLSANYVRNRSSNELTNYALPSTTGFGGVIANFPATVQNIAWEFSTSMTIVKTNNFNWSANVNLTVPSNKLIAFPSLASSTYAGSLFIGQPVNAIQVYHFLGVDPATGNYSFSDSKGNPTSTPNFSTDRTVQINPNPKFYGGFQNSFSYRGFQLDVLFQFVNQIGANTFFSLGTVSPGNFGFNSTNNLANQPVSVLGRWQKPGDITSIEKFGSLSKFSLLSGVLGSNAGYSDASFIRLKNLSLSYRFSERLIQKIHLSGARLYVQAQNLFTQTKYKGMDPENRSVSSLPLLRVLTVGFKVDL